MTKKVAPTQCQAFVEPTKVSCKNVGAGEESQGTLWSRFWGWCCCPSPWAVERGPCSPEPQTEGPGAWEGKRLGQQSRGLLPEEVASGAGQGLEPGASPKGHSWPGTFSDHF